jgi:hypothetical protein
MASNTPMIVRMKMVAKSNNAILTTEWKMVVRRFNLREADKVLFCFYERYDAKLDFLVEAPPV